MAKGVTVKVEGLSLVEAALANLPKATGRNVIRRVAVKRLKPIAEDMKRKAPVDQSDLVDSITVTTKRPKKARKRSEVEAYAGPGRHPQAHLQEFGTQHHGPQAFARPAWDAGKDDLLPGLADDCWDEISKANARIAKKALKARG